MNYSDYEPELYKEFKPTTFDHHINIDHHLDDDDSRENWLVVLVSQNRDSAILEKSNFESALEILGGESDTIEIHRFGHWGPGWFEIIIAHPSRLEDVAKIAFSLANYPILNESDYSEKEVEAIIEYWENMSLREKIDLCIEENCSIFSARREEIPEKLWERLSVWVNE